MTFQRVFAITAAMVMPLMACTQAPSAGSPVPGPLPIRSDSATPAVILRLPQERTRYSLQQTSSIENLEAQHSAASGGNITTTAILDFIVDSTDISGLSFTITADSLQTTTEGSIPSHRVVPLRIGPVLRGRVTDGQILATGALPDSLCAYSHLLTAAFHVLLPQLSAEVSLPLSRPITDTLLITSCRAGARIQLQTRRRVQSSSGDSSTLTLEEQVELSGAGIIRRDSIRITGFITTTGEIIFRSDSRLPELVQTKSDGTITVQLAGSTTTFRQYSAQQLKQHP